MVYTPKYIGGDASSLSCRGSGVSTKNTIGKCQFGERVGDGRYWGLETVGD